MRAIVANLSRVCMVGCLWSSNATAAETPGSQSRKIAFEVVAQVESVPQGQGPIHLWIPIPLETPVQTVHTVKFEGVEGAEWRDPVHGNRYWHAVVEQSKGGPIVVRATFEITRRPAPSTLSKVEPRSLTAAEVATHQRYLQPADRVPVGRDIAVLAPVLAQVHESAGTSALPDLARAVYDVVIDTMDYKKTGTGWGNGDTYWACSERYGNCTDFHSLFLSLARTEGIPARFEMGFPIPLDRDSGQVSGYHCWLQFWLPGAGWVPIDASEADKNPAQKDALYGQQPADRILFTVGRDLRLGPDHQDAPLNYFIDPYAEVAGEAWPQVTHQYSYRNLD